MANEYFTLVITAVGVFLAVRLLFSAFSRKDRQANEEFQDILHSEEHKVKGRFD